MFVYRLALIASICFTLFKQKKKYHLYFCYFKFVLFIEMNLNIMFAYSLILSVSKYFNLFKKIKNESFILCKYI